MLDGKVCSSCGDYKPWGDYYKNKKAKDGHYSRCKSCHNESTRRWQRANPERHRANVGAWQRANPERAASLRRDANRRYRQRQRDAVGSHTEQEWESLRDRYGRCLCCGRTDRPLERDHVVPLSQGGDDTIDNLQPLCHPCNTTKRDKIIDYREAVV